MKISYDFVFFRGAGGQSGNQFNLNYFTGIIHFIQSFSVDRLQERDFLSFQKVLKKKTVKNCAFLGPLTSILTFFAIISTMHRL